LNIGHLALWQRLQNEISVDVIKWISEYDFYDADEHYRALWKIYTTSEMPDPFKWEPREVLSLVSHIDYKNEDSQTVLKVLFCNTILLAAAVMKGSDNSILGIPDKLITAIDCACILGEGVVVELYDFLAFLNTKCTYQIVEENILYFLLAEYLLCRISGKDNNELSEILLEAELIAANIYDMNVDYYLDIFKYTFHDSKVTLWREYYNKYCDQHDKLRIKKIGYLFNDHTIEKEPDTN